MRLAVIHHRQDVVRNATDGSAPEAKAQVPVMHQPFSHEYAAAAALAPFRIVIPMRTRFAAGPVGRQAQRRLASVLALPDGAPIPTASHVA